MTLPADLTDMSCIGGLVERCVAELGGLNILVANAGVTRDTLKPAPEYPSPGASGSPGCGPFPPGEKFPAIR